MELVWKIKQPSNSSGSKEYQWLYPRDLLSIGEELSEAMKVYSEKKDFGGNVWTQDLTSPGTLSYIPKRAAWDRSSDWSIRYEGEPCGIRIPSTREGGMEAIVIFTWSTKVLEPRVLITFKHALTVDQLPNLLEALDEIGSKGKREEGWIWNIDPDSDLVKAWSQLDGRDIVVKKRAERDGHLLGVAWYGPGEGRLLDGQMWSWC